MKQYICDICGKIDEPGEYFSLEAKANNEADYGYLNNNFDICYNCMTKIMERLSGIMEVEE